MIDRSELEHYNRSMAAATEDKLWFLDHIPDRCLIVDFGCANGHLCQAAQAFSGDHMWFGVENHPLQFELASQRTDMVEVATTYEELRGSVRSSDRTRVALFSSVLHEAPDILPSDYADDFDFICIRDMGVADGGSYEPVAQHVAERVKAHPHWDAFYAAKDRQYEERGWQLTLDYQLVTEFLLKYRYLDDPTSDRFKREVGEAYPIRGAEGFLANETPGFATTRFEAYSLPYLRERWGRDFGFDWPYTTHFKVILEKNPK